MHPSMSVDIPLSLASTVVRRFDVVLFDVLSPCPGKAYVRHPPCCWIPIAKRSALFRVRIFICSTLYTTFFSIFRRPKNSYAFLFVVYSPPSKNVFRHSCTRHFFLVRQTYVKTSTFVRRRSETWGGGVDRH